MPQELPAGTIDLPVRLDREVATGGEFVTDVAEQARALARKMVA